MATPRIAPYGSWESPIGSDLIASASIAIGSVTVSGDAVYWLEGRPLEGGRNVLVRRAPDGTTADVTPPGFSVRTLVHEYGGGAYWLHGDTVFFANFADQRLYRQDPGQEPRPITPEPPAPAALRYADGCVTPDGRLIICVQEEHRSDGAVVNRLVALPTDGSAAPRVIAEGHDFYSFPRISPDGTQLAWTTWDHPRMPWDGTDLWVARLEGDGSLSDVRHVAGGPEESIFQPAWSPDGTLHFISDRTGWWNLYALREGSVTPLAPMEAEFGVPQWVFGLSTYAFLPDGRIACIYSQHGLDYLGVIASGRPGVQPVATAFTSLGSICAAPAGDRVWLIAASAAEAAGVAAIDLTTGHAVVVRRSLTIDLDPAYLSVPGPIAFPTDGGATAYALFYPPRNRDCIGPPDERPPLLVFSHGGPTGQTSSRLNLGIQYWTSRGFAVVDVNYGGSTGYGRAYRERLKGNWGIVDVADCVNAARYLANQGRVDGARLAIRGGSAGGYTTLCALAFTDAFAAGASYFGVADAAALARDTHKFESRYLDGLIGPYPAAEALYRERSALYHADRISCPVILLQGLEDKVVPPSQAEAMVKALAANRVPHAYLTFEGEQHGFRKAESIRRSLDAEYYFYARVLGFPPSGHVEPVPIAFLD
ncbi:MAG: S9 family peptidase [Sphaerobacter sp.]|nr:S9 family peptidase [Sphaerobacter sp.]